jgi:hypothetical protein
MEEQLSPLYFDCQRYLEACGWHQRDCPEFDDDGNDISDWTTWHKGDRSLQMFQLVPEGSIQMQTENSAYVITEPLELRLVVELAA